MKIARVLITTGCNLKCTYCCNKIPEVQDTFKMVTFDQFVENANQYDVINISGGEPMLVIEKMQGLIRCIEYSEFKGDLYLYTNGYEDRYGDIDFVSPHIDGG